MKRLPAAFVTIAVGLGFSAAALAQQYKWVDQNGRIQYGDAPPPGVQAQRLKPPPSGAAPAARKDDKGKGLSPEAAFRKRQEDAEKDRQKQEQEELAATAKRENCTRAQEQLRQLESGQRIARVDAKGERYFMDDAQIQQELARTRQIVQQSCN
jgi:hypothetical protein